MSSQQLLFLLISYHQISLKWGVSVCSRQRWRTHEEPSHDESPCAPPPYEHNTAASSVNERLGTEISRENNNDLPKYFSTIFFLDVFFGSFSTLLTMTGWRTLGRTNQQEHVCRREVVSNYKTAPLGRYLEKSVHIVSG